jgi:hypothetical protein
LEKYYSLIVAGLHYLSAKWRNYLPANAETLPDLSPQEQLVLNQTEPFRDHITVGALQVIHPYLPQEQAQLILESLLQKAVLEKGWEGGYRYTPRTKKYMSEVGQALLSYVELNTLMPFEQANRLAVLTTALLDKLCQGSNPVPTPIFNMCLKSIAPSEHPLGVVQQRLNCLMGYRDDTHIAAWRAEEYTPGAIRVASQLFTLPEGSTVDGLLKSPLLFSESYVRSAIDELRQHGDVLDTGIGYTLTGKGIIRRDRVELLTEQHFAHPFEHRMSESGRKEWVTLMSSLLESAKTVKNAGS